MILRILQYFHFYWRNPNYVWGMGHYCKCKKGQIKQYYAKSSYGTDSAPLKNTLKHFISVEARSLSLRDSADIRERHCKLSENTKKKLLIQKQYY